MKPVFSDDDINAAYRVAYFLHPDTVVAFNVTIDAVERFWLLRLQQERRRASEKSFKLVLPLNLLLQRSVYWVSDEWERDQESDLPLKPYQYKPNRDDLIVRYVKLLVWQAMDRTSCNAALGLGCLLYRYDASQIHDLAPDIFNENNLRRSKLRLVDRITERFKPWNIVDEDRQVRSRSPSADERTLVQQLLCGLSPWLPSGLPHMPYAGGMLPTFFGYLSDRTEAERVHVLIDPYCGGLSRLITEYNENLPKGNERMKLDEPERKLKVPDFDASEERGPSDRSNPPSLTTNELISIRRAIDERDRRRQGYRGDLLRARVDGTDYVLRPSAGNYSASLLLKDDASYMEILGQDDQGEILLAAFYFSEDYQNEGDREFRVRDETGLETLCSISRVSGSETETVELKIQVRYATPGIEGHYDTKNVNFEKQSVSKHPVSALIKAPSFPSEVGYSRFLWRLIGCSNWILEKPAFVVERPKYTAIGMSLLCSSVFASLSTGYFLYLLTRSALAATLGGFFWFIAIITFDRFILMAARSEEHKGFYRRFLIALPRFAVGLLLAAVTAFPIQLRLFDREVELKMAQTRGATAVAINQTADRMFSEIPQYETTRAQLQMEIVDRQRERDRIYEGMMDELVGRTGSGRYGSGPVYAARLSQLKNTDQELALVRERNEPKIDEVSKKLDDLRNQRRDWVARSMQGSSDTLLARLTALNALSRENGIVTLMGVALVLLLLFMNMLPILTQLLAGRGMYESFIWGMTQDAQRRFEQDFEATTAQEIEERIEEVANLVRFRSKRVA